MPCRRHGKGDAMSALAVVCGGIIVILRASGESVTSS